jgi:hypothetical protein
MNLRLSLTIALLFAVEALATSSAALAITYKVTLLNPPGFGSEGRGISGPYQVGSGGGEATGGSTHALLWNSTADSFVDLNPPDFTVSYALGVSGNSQVGFGTRLAGHHALLWHGSAESFVDLDPGTFNGGTYAVGASNSTQVGYGLAIAPGQPTQSHALMWQGTAASVIDLTPELFFEAVANDASEESQVGSGRGTATGNLFHALLWHGTAASAVDLNPAGFESSEAFGVSGLSQVGSGYPSTGGDRHALLWNGTAASAVDLHPAGFDLSEARGVSAAGQVGFGIVGLNSSQHALFWNNTADSVIDLHPFLSDISSTLFASTAWGIADNSTIVGTAFDPFGGTYAILWTPVPEPHSLALIACSVMLAFIRRARCNL